MKLTGYINRVIAATFVFFVFIAAGAYALEDASAVVIDRFSGAVGNDGLPQGWKFYALPRKKSPTRYSVREDGSNWFLEAESKESASAIYKELRLDIKKTPILRWRWKIDHTLKKGDERTRDGDDYAGRVYVTFQYEPEKSSFYDRVKRAVAEKVFGIALPGNTVNYIWANKLPKDEAAYNPYTDQVVMIAVESGNRLSGQWVSEERDVYADYRRFFNEDPPEATGIVIMTDTDNTRESTVAFYDEISFTERR